MRLGGVAAYLVEVTTRRELQDAYAWASQNQLPMIMIGDGSNIVWRDEGYKGLVIVNRIMGLETVLEDENMAYLTIGGGEEWDSVVSRTVEMNLNGLAELSLIPGTAGATPVQNVGAYGQEISKVLMTLEVFDTLSGKLMNMTAGECQLGYRTSRFKTTDKGRFFITSITVMLSKTKPVPPFYDAVQRYLNEKQITDYTPKVIRDAVIAIRSAKLPDPAKVANNGSFFKNPMVDSGKLTQLLATNPDLQYWSIDGGAKLSAAWLIEKAGFKDYHDQATGMATWPTQPLVLVNEHARSTADLLNFKARIVDTVNQKFGVTLDQEPEILP
jgi:UDP-N-acetylmuramate dehydrogenase